MRDLATEFEAERDHLMAVAYRMLGSRAEAEDVVQDTWLRYASALADPAVRAGIRDLRAWLTTTAGRICLDVLRSARVRREAYPGQWLPEPLVERLPGPTAPGVTNGYAPDPAERAVRTDEVSIALLILLERLTPEQRVAFVLHDVFALPFEQIAQILGGTPAAARQLASRARRAVADGSPRHTADPAEQRQALAAFLAAIESGDLERLVAVLAPDVVFTGDSGGHFPSARHPVTGREKVARLTLGILHRLPKRARARGRRLVLVNGSRYGLQGEAVWQDDRLFRFVLWVEAENGLVTRIYNQLNPEKLRHVPLIGQSGSLPPSD